MKRYILISIISLTMLLSSCTSCSPKSVEGDSSEQTSIFEESSTSENSQKFGNDSGESAHYSEASHTGLGDKKDDTSGTLTGKEQSSKPEESSKAESSKPEESSKEESSKTESSKPEESSKEESSSKLSGRR